MGQPGPLYLTVDLVGRGRLDVVGDEQVVRLLHDVCVVLEVVTVVVLDPPLVVALHQHGNDDNQDDQDDAAPHAADDEPPLQVVTSEAVHVHLGEVRAVARGALQYLALGVARLLQLPEPEQTAVTLQGNSCMARSVRRHGALQHCSLT